jgi:macrolide transport system ATP-binding/permease protein
MAADRRPLALTLALLWIATWEPLAPADRRATWRDQWRADLWHYAAWLSRHHTTQFTVAWKLLARASAAPPHACLLRLHSWSLHMLAHDLRFAWRMIVRRPAFTLVAILILGLGIGANATIFSWVETVLLSPLSGVESQHRLVSLRGTTPTGGDTSFSYLNYVDLQAARPAGFEDVIAFRGLPMSLKAGDEPMRLWGQLVTANFFDVLRVPPVLGRTFVPADTAAFDKEPVAVISHGLWTRVFAKDPGIIDRVVILNGQLFTIVGVSAEGFRGSLVGLTLDVFVPLTMQRTVLGGNRLPARGNAFLQVFGRLAPGASMEQAQASASTVAARLAADHPDTNAGRGTRVIPLWKDGAGGFLLPVMVLLMSVVGIVLVIACANLAGLLVARAAGRQREVAVRLAVGASRGRVIRQFLVEACLLAAGGGAAGIILSYWTSGLLNRFLPPTPAPMGFETGISTSVLLFSVTVTALAAALVGLLPAIRASRPDVAVALKESAPAAIGGPRRGRLRQVLVVSQVALSLLLLTGASLFGRSLAQANSADPGFSLRQGMIASLDLLANGYDEKRGILFFRELVQRLSRIPEVQGVSVATRLPLDASPNSNMSVEIPGYELAKGEEIAASYSRVGPGFFDAMGIPIVGGRGIDERDSATSELAVVINETMARKYFRGRDAVGARLRYGRGPAHVVGVARDGKYLRLSEEPRNYMYVPITQFYRPEVSLVVRSASDAARIVGAVRAEIARLDPNLPLFDVRTVDEYRQFSRFIPRMASILLGAFGFLALLLAAVGLYSVIAFAAAQRTHEIGVRLALGADRRDVVRLVLRQGVAVTAAGIVTGSALAFVATRLVADQLIGVSHADPASWGFTIGMLVLVSLTACAVPALRAASLDPLKALRRD